MALQNFENLINRIHDHHTYRPRLKDRSNPFEALSNIEFKRRFRLEKQIAIFCIELVAADLTVPVRRGVQLSLAFQFLVALRFYSCGTFQLVVADLNCLCQASVCNIVHRVSKSIAKRSREFIRWPNLPEAEVIRRKFFEIVGFPGVVGAIDYTHIHIESPGGPNAELFRNRKGNFSINVPAVCDSELNFTNVVARWYGSAHDSRIFENSNLNDELEDRQIPRKLVGDSGYPLLTYLMTPYERPQTVAQRRYNVAQVKTRNPIERAFGVVKRRFACLKGMRLKLENVLTVIVATMVLHNISRRFNDEIEEDDEINGNEVDDPNHPEQRNDNRGDAVRTEIVLNHFTR